MDAKDIKIVYLDINKLKPADYNPRSLTEKQYGDIVNSINTFGFIDPLIINNNPKRKHIIVGGHQRVKVAKALGYASLPCVLVNLSLAKEKELNIRLNKNTGSFDYDILANEYEVEDLISYGFEAYELGGSEELEEDEPDELNPTEAISFTIKCSNLEQLGELNDLLGVEGKSCDYQTIKKRFAK